MGSKQDKLERIASNSPTYFVLFTILFIIATLDFGYSQKVMKAHWTVLVFFFTFPYQYSYKGVTVLTEKKMHALTSLEEVSTFILQYSSSHASFTATINFIASSNENF